MKDPFASDSGIDSPAHESMKNVEGCYSRSIFKTSTFSNSRRALQSGAEKISKTFRSVRNSFGSLTQHFRLGGRRRHRLTDATSTCRTPGTPVINKKQTNIHHSSNIPPSRASRRTPVLFLLECLQMIFRGSPNHKPTSLIAKIIDNKAAITLCNVVGDAGSYRFQSRSAKLVLGRSPARLYSPFGIETPQCRDFRMSPYMPDTPEHGLSPKRKGMAHTWSKLSKKRPRALFQ